MTDDRQLVAHLLRRTTFGPFPGQVEALSAGGLQSALDAVISAPPLALAAPNNNATSQDEDMVTPWLQLMRRPEAGLHEKMVWFWHGHFTSSLSAVDDRGYMHTQHLLHRRYALGNFRSYAQAISVDPAMLIYLNGDGSDGSSPNENYSRELMELFTMGRGNYTQSDVAAGARALAGWSVDTGSRSAVFSEDAAYQGEVEYLGHRGRLRTTDVVDIACDHPATARFIVTKLHRYLTGNLPSEEQRDRLARLFGDSGLEIQPVVEAVVRDPSFFDSRLNRARLPVEWIGAAVAAVGISDADDAKDQVSAGLADGLGQVPFDPPNVAGWPISNRWLSGTAALVRAGLAVQASGLREVAEASDPVAATLGRCSLYEVGPETHQALEQVAADLSDAQLRAATLLGLAIASPEFAVA